ncbi:MAG TPA: TolC family protein [Solimonas sp.]|nr:TolC family protein [Solimonas sp.]
MNLRFCCALAALAWPATAALAEPMLAELGQTSPAALELEEAAELAVAAQPLLDAQRQAVRAARAEAVAAAQLPDPTLVAGLSDLPVSGPDRLSLSRESDTQLMLGLKQSFPGAGKRGLREQRGVAESERLEAEFREQVRMVRREAGLAWLEVWKSLEAQRLTRASLVEAQRQVQAVDIAYRSGRAAQADLLAARVSHELLGDQLAKLQQEEGHARNSLRRWIGPDAERLICPDLPGWPAPDAQALIAHLERHPHLAAQDHAVEVAHAERGLAAAGYRPDWSVQLGYGHRPAFPDYASVQFEVGLPLFTRNRQDREVEASAARVAQAENLKQDWLRQHRAGILLNVSDWQRLQQRLARYDGAILPPARLRLEATLAAYAAGNGPLAPLFDARRGLLDIGLQRLDLQVDAARHLVELQYFAPAAAPELLP